MKTQLASTPIIYGEEARKILKEAKTVQNEISKENAKKLIEYYKQFTKE